MSKQYLALFDLDGTLFDTGKVNYYAYKDALADFDATLAEDFFVTKCNGRHYTEFLPEIMGSSEHIDEVHRAKKEAYAKNLDKARQNIHLFEMIKSMTDTYHTAIVTTASRKNTEDILSHFACMDLFEYILTQEDITKVKPDPQGFLMAMEHFGIDAAHTVIFEDSPVGIQAAKASGASVMVVSQF